MDIDQDESQQATTQLRGDTISRFGWAYALIVPAASACMLMRAQGLFREPRLKLEAAVTCPQLTITTDCTVLLPLEFLASRAHWLAMVTLMTTVGIAALAFALFTVGRLFSPRQLWRNGLGVLALIASLGFSGYSYCVLHSVKTDGFLSLLVNSLSCPLASTVRTDVMAPRLIGEGAALAIAISFAALTTFGDTITSSELAARFHSLRTTLYVGSALFVVGVMMCKANFAWVFANWGVLHTGIRAAQAAVVSAGVAQAGAAYSALLLAAALPARLLLERKLASAMSDGERGAWRTAHSLTTTWQSEVQQILAVLAPVLSAPVLDVLVKS